MRLTEYAQTCKRALYVKANLQLTEDGEQVSGEAYEWAEGSKDFIF